jgi:ligand-binding sensor domain-containing protein
MIRFIAIAAVARWPGWRALRHPLQVLVGAALVAGLAWAGSLLRTQSALPAKWKVCKLPRDVAAVTFQGDVVWAGGRFGLLPLDAQGIPLQPKVPIPDLFRVSALTTDTQGRLWVAHSTGVMIFDGQSWQPFSLGSEVENSACLALCLLDDGAIWVGTEQGAICCRGETRRRYTVADGLTTDRVECICEDSSGTLWFGSGAPLTGGLTTFDGKTWRRLRTGVELPSSAVSNVWRHAGGALWLAAGEGRIGVVSCLADGRWRHWRDEQGLARGKVRSIYVDNQGRLWAGHESEGLSIVAGSQAVHLTPRDGLPDWEVKCIATDGNGTVWLGTGGGLVRADESSVNQLWDKDPP